MDSAKLNDWMQLVGIFAVVASLIFVGLQMKQSQDIAIAAQYQVRYAAALEVQSQRQLNENHVRMVGEREIKKDGLPAGFDKNTNAAEYGSRFLDVRMTLLVYDNLHFQYGSGFLADDAWAPYRETLRRAVQLPIYEHYLKNYGYRQRASYQMLLEQLQDEPQPDLP